MKSFYSTLILLLIVAAVGGYIYFNERGPIPEAGSTVLLRTEPQKISSLRLKQAGGQIVVLQKSGDEWRVLRRVARGDAPAVPADADAVKALLDQIQLVQSAAVVPNEPGKLKEYGLDKPQTSLTEDDDSSIEFGAKLSFDPTKIYARVENKVALLPTTLSDAVAKPFSEWRDKAVLRVSSDDTTQLELKAPALPSAATFVKEDKGDSEEESKAWKISQPVQALADAGTVESFLNQLPVAQAVVFLEDDPKSLAKWGLDKPSATVKVTSEKGTRMLLVGKKLSGGYAAKNSASPAVFKIEDATFGLINRPLREWRSKSVLKLTLSDPTRVEITSRGTSRSFQKSNDKWQPVGGTGSTSVTSGGADAAHEAVLSVLLAVQDLTAQDFIDKAGPPATYGLDKPVVQLKITSSQAGTPSTLQIGTKNGKVYAHTVQGDSFAPTVYLLSSTALENFKKGLDVLFPTPKSPAPKSPTSKSIDNSSPTKRSGRLKG